MVWSRKFGREPFLRSRKNKCSIVLKAGQFFKIGTSRRYITSSSKVITCFSKCEHNHVGGRFPPDHLGALVAIVPPARPRTVPTTFGRTVAFITYNHQSTQSPQFVALRRYTVENAYSEMTSKTRQICICGTRIIFH